ncbi:branched-chain amino acid transport system substrate-binding protein [Deinococcus reticulitermitis]|uniref:Branched-chain amino acid transport system substrate-binding protein n=1 Tax=Deinococcus reticulitermitis TaxID=856736 RepID=A0A1H6ZA09_9DEIO|nr:ABC transporter substrate-binding protein [Deinococcus reticulitermitis]SEJ50321.1 branched-chain amino acid transport system substrate-binding protein [Deinococcus reticulitermitis]
MKKVITLALALAASSALAQDTVKIGVILPVSGVYAQLGEEGWKGFTLYMDSIGNKVAGKTIQVVREDEEADAGVALRKANKLISSDKVDLLAGVVLTPSAYALAPVVEKAKVPLIVFNAAGNDLTRSRKNPYVFRVSGNAWQYNNPFGKYVAQKVSKNTFLVAADYAFGKESIADFKAAYTKAGGKVAGEVYTPLGSNDFSAYMARIAAAKPEAVYAVLSGSDAVLFMKQFAQFGLQKSVKLAVFGDMTDEKFIGAVGDSTVGALSALPWAQNLANAENRKFVAAYTKKYKDLPGVFAERGWVTARVIAEALKKTGGKTDDKAALLAAIRGVNFPAPRGVFRFDAVTQNVINPMYVRQVVKGPGGLYNKQVVKLGDFRDPGK